MSLWLLDQFEEAFFACALPVLYAPAAVAFCCWVGCSVALTNVDA